MVSPFLLELEWEISLSDLSIYAHRETYNWGEKRYLIAKKPGARISFPFEVKAKPIIIPGESPQGEGWVKIGHLRSNVLHLGSVDCWVGREGESEKTRIDGWWETKERNMGV